MIANHKDVWTWAQPFYISSSNKKKTVMRVRTGFNAYPDPAFNLNADPDPGQTLPSQKLKFTWKIYFMQVIDHKTYLRR